MESKRILSNRSKKKKSIQQLFGQKSTFFHLFCHPLFLLLLFSIYQVLSTCCLTSYQQFNDQKLMIRLQNCKKIRSRFWPGLQSYLVVVSRQIQMFVSKYILSNPPPTQCPHAEKRESRNTLLQDDTQFYNSVNTKHCLKFLILFLSSSHFTPSMKSEAQLEVCLTHTCAYTQM